MSNKIYTEVDPYTGASMEEDAPTNSNAAGGVAMPPDAMMKKKKKKNLLDARTKAYREHARKLQMRREKKSMREGSFQSSVLASVQEFGIESLLAEENLDVMRSIVKSKQAKNLKFKDGTMKCDLMTASVITQVYDKVNDANKAKLKPMMNGKKGDFLKLQNIAFKVAK